MITATLNAIDNRESFHCETCLSSREGALLEKSRKIKGCYAPQVRASLKTEDLEYYRCPGNFFSYQVVSLLSMERQFEKGIMPYSGSMMDQPAKILDIFYMIERHRQDKLEKDQSKKRLQEKVANRDGRYNRSRR